MRINEIYTMDVFDFLSQVPPKTVDLAVVDPPYNMHKAEWDKFASEPEFLEFTYQWIDAMLSALKQTASVYIFNTPYNAAYILQYLVKKGLVFQNWITWDKRDGLNASKVRYTHGQETILFFTMSKDYVFNAEEIRVPYESTERIRAASKKGILKNGKRWYPNPRGRLCGEVWHIASERHKQKLDGKTPKLAHVTPKPVEMIERMIKASSKEGDLVLDPFVGSGTTAVCAKRLSRNYLCADNNEYYVKIAKERIKNEYVAGE